MDSMRIIIVIFFTSLSFVAHSYGDLIDDVCQKTIDYNLCVKSLRADPRSASADKKSLARIIIQLSQDKANDILSQTEMLLKQTKEPVLKQCLEVCKEMYDTAVFHYSEAVNYLDADNFSDAADTAGETLSDADTCDESFTEPTPVLKSPLKPKTDDFFHFADLTLSLLNQFKSLKTPFH
ncbi:pectinesterase inhibitor-like [Nicotiana tomentosiformis]|uniref:pectinesterase inhibitor-like n=1 Tax=Nicotiana tomentosiformis TaxID=4098 RepID=UPI00388CB094